MPSKFRDFLKKLGPGFTTGASDDDPSGIATYSQVGAKFGFGQLWSVLFTFPMMLAIQEMVGRIGMTTGRGLTANVRKFLPKWALIVFVFLLLGANTINIGANLGAMADASKLLFPKIPFVFYAVTITVFILFLEIFLSYKVYARVLKWLALSLLSYLVTAILVTTDIKAVFLGALVPHFEFTGEYFMMITAVLGTTISPYLFVWQSDEEVEEEIGKGRTTIKQRKGATKEEIKDMREDTFVGMGFSQLIMFCIIVTAANTFFKHGLHDIQTSAQAAQALEPLAGRFASLIYSIGIIGTGLLAVPVLSASASYAMSQAFGWKNGFYKKFKEAHGFYGIITLATLVGLLINFVGVNPIQALIWAAVLNGLVTPFMILFILKIANDKKAMGGKWVNGRLSNTVGILTFLAMSTSAILMFVL